MAERREVSRRDREVVGGGEVLQPPLEVANLHGDARQHLLLNRHAELPVSADARPTRSGGSGRSPPSFACAVPNVVRRRGETFAVGARCW